MTKATFPGQKRFTTHDGQMPCDNIGRKFDNSMPSFASLHKLRPAPFFVIPGLATELGQATARLCWAPAFTIYLLLSDQFHNTPEAASAWLLVTAQFLYAVIAWCVVHWKFGNSNVRQMASTFLDHAHFAALLYLTGEIAAPFIFMPLMQTFGTGLRFGRAHAVFSKLVGSTLTCAALLYSPYWAQFPTIRVGLMIAIIILPFYVFRLTDALALKMRTDSLTGLRNRISFDELIDEACNSAVTAKRDSAVILLDLDGFKQINDVQGHDGGDLVLKHVAYWLSVELSQYGTAARFGGDEFAVIANSMQSRAELEAALERFLERTAEVGRLFDSPLGASIGVYYLDAGVATTSRFAFKAADQLMYRAKTLGKNQYVTSTNRAFSKIGELVEPSLPLPS